MSNQGDFLGRLRDNWQQRAGERTTFRVELRVIPRWLVRVVLGLCLVGAAAGVLVGIYSPGIEITQPLARRVPANAIFILLVMALISVVVLFYGYIAADAKRRGMSPVLWLLVSLLVPYLIGAILYFVVRKPLPLECPQCGRSVDPHFNFCPGCQFNLRPNCPQCRRGIRSGDRFCPHCGEDLQSHESVQAGPPEA
jgi:Double zinc ribbon